VTGKVPFSIQHAAEHGRRRLRYSARNVSRRSNPMSDPYGYDRNSDPRYDPNVDDSGATALWAGIAVAALLIVGGFLYFTYDRSDNIAANAPGAAPRATMPSPAPGTPPAGTTGSGGASTPSTTGSAPSR